ncbi:MAG: hypothetical protein ACRD2B_11540 [Terriglobia bacterium]
MKKRFVFAFLCMSLIAAGPVNAHGQSTAPAAEVFIGGAKVWTYAPTDHFDSHGWGGSVTGNLNQYLGIEADLFKYPFFGHEPPAWSTHYTLLFGPHFTYRRIQALAPFGHLKVTESVPLEDILPGGRAKAGSQKGRIRKL